MANGSFFAFLFVCISVAFVEGLGRIAATNARSQVLRHRRSAAAGDESVAARLEELAEKYDDLESSFQDVMKSNRDLLATVLYQDSRIQQMQHIVVEQVPYALEKANYLEGVTHELRDRIDDLTIEKLKPCACPEHNFNARVRLKHDWLNDIEPQMIEKLRKDFYTNDAAMLNRKSMDAVEDEEMLDENTIGSLSRVLTNLVMASESGYLAGDEGRETTPSSDKLDVHHRKRLPDEATVWSKTKDKQGDQISASSSNGHKLSVERQMEEAVRSISKSKKKMAFSVVLTSPLLGSDEPQTVVFNEQTVRIGKGYDTKKGVFRCNIPGIYYFSFTVCSYDDKHIAVVLLLNDQYVVASSTDKSSRKVMQSQSVMLSLSKGDQVWLMMGGSHDYAIYGRNDDYHYNTFNGVLLYPG